MIKKFSLRITFCIILPISAMHTVASELMGIVVKVADGDTITILDKNNKQHRIRFAQIDAPESNQPYGTKSKTYLMSRVAGKNVQVSVAGQDRYKRSIGTIFLDGSNINEEQVAQGNAWVYRKYATDKNLYKIENKAKKNQLGLWALPEHERVPPWVWRKTNAN